MADPLLEWLARDFAGMRFGMLPHNQSRWRFVPCPSLVVVLRPGKIQRVVAPWLLPDQSCDRTRQWGVENFAWLASWCCWSKSKKGRVCVAGVVAFCRSGTNGFYDTRSCESTTYSREKPGPNFFRMHYVEKVRIFRTERSWKTDTRSVLLCLQNRRYDVVVRFEEEGIVLDISDDDLHKTYIFCGRRSDMHTKPVDKTGTRIILRKIHCEQGLQVYSGIVPHWIVIGGLSKPRTKKRGLIFS